MAAEEQGSSREQAQQGGEGPGRSTVVKAAATAAAAGVAALATKKALSGRGSANGGSSDGSARSKSEMGSTINSMLSGGWDAARDALIPAAEDAAGAVGEYLAENGPEVIRERIVPRFISSFNEARET
jgi:hypothetical protein